MEIRRLLDFLKTAEQLKCNTRHSYTSSGRLESVAEHSWRLALMAMLVGDEFPELDMDKVIKMCLIHDMGEAITGDIPAFVKTDSDREVEESAISNVTAMLPETERKELDALFDELEKADDFDMAVHDLIKKYATEHQRIVFNGNGYSDEWVEEAERRGLPNIKSMVDAIPALNTEKAVSLFERFGVFTKAELDSRVEIEYETYAKEINIEAKAMIDIAGKQIIPAVIKYTTELATSAAAVKSVCDADISVQTELLAEVSDLLSETKVALAKLEEVTEKGGTMEEGRNQAVYYRDVVKTAMDALRAPVDKLEMLVDKDIWPMPSYGDLIFEV